MYHDNADKADSNDDPVVDKKDLGNTQKWDWQKDYHFVCMPSKASVPYPSLDLPEELVQVAVAVISSDDASKQEDLFSFKEPLEVSKYALELEQLDNGKKISPNPGDWRCEITGATENLWLNLSTGHIGDGRPQYDGTGGSGAALKHYEETGRKYPLVVKLGTITPKGADVYSYAPDEDCMVEDPFLAQHLAHFGIDIMKMEKTEKSMSELELDLSMKMEFDRIQESGEALEALSGANYVGLHNIGNSCYINSLLQLLFSLPEFKERYLDQAQGIFSSASTDPISDFNVQMAKLAVALLTDTYTERVKEVPEDNNVAEPTYTIAPKMLKVCMLAPGSLHCIRYWSMIVTYNFLFTENCCEGKRRIQ